MKGPILKFIYFKRPWGVPFNHERHEVVPTPYLPFVDNPLGGLKGLKAIRTTARSNKIPEDNPQMDQYPFLLSKEPW